MDHIHPRPERPPRTRLAALAHRWPVTTRRRLEQDALDRITDLLNRTNGRSSETTKDIVRVIGQTGRRVFLTATITAQELEQCNGRPLAYVDADTLAVYVFQRDDGDVVIDAYPRDDQAREHLHIQLDGLPVPLP